MKTLFLFKRGGEMGHLNRVNYYYLYQLTFLIDNLGASSIIILYMALEEGS